MVCQQRLLGEPRHYLHLAGTEQGSQQRAGDGNHCQELGALLSPAGQKKVRRSTEANQNSDQYFIHCFTAALVLSINSHINPVWLALSLVLNDRVTLTCLLPIAKAGSLSPPPQPPKMSQVQDTEPAAIPPSPQKACRLVDRLSSFRVQGSVPGTIPAPAPSPIPGASDSGEPQKPCGARCKPVGEG